MLRTVRAVALAFVGLVVTGYGYQPPSQSWPPGVQPVAPVARALTPAEALTTFALPPGFRIELVAAEPLVQDPIMMDWDAAGRLWVVELPGYMRDITAEGELDPVGRIVVLEDEDNDGTMDKRTVFADKLIQPRALKVLDHGVLVGEAPDIWLMRDTDGDLHADTKERVATGYGRRAANVEVNANSLFWALDNRLYGSGLAADMYLRLKDGTFEVHESLSRGQWGVTEDDAGHIFRNHNESPLHADLVPTPYYARNPNLVRTRGSHERLADTDRSITTVWPAHQTPGTNRAYQHGILRDDKTLARYTAACAPTIFRGDRLPADLYGNAFVAEPAANLVSRFILSDDGTTLRARKAYDHAEFLTSTDERFRPVHLANAPDGTLYIADMYRGIIQHGAYITEYLRGQILSRHLEQPTGYGRIYRVVHETTKRDTERMIAPAPAKLVDKLSDASGWWRQTAQRLLVERGDRSVVPALVALAGKAPDWRTRLHALWTLDGLDAIEPDVVSRALGDESRDVRVSALRIAERWLGQPGHPIQAAVLKHLDDPDWAVREQYAASIGALPVDARDAAAAALLGRHGDDPIITDAALSGLAGQESAVLGRLLTGPPDQGVNPHVEAALTMLAATIVRSAQDAHVQNLFASAADPARASWQRSALLGGAEIALLGAPIPGMAIEERPVTAGTAAPCPTCPGGRGGPGGAYAFPAAQAATAAAGRAVASTRARATTLSLGGEPQGLATLSARGGEAGARAAKLLARMTWPGKEGAAPAIPALTAQQQQRFEAGREVYRNICQGCHGPDGQGIGAIGAPLVGSTLVFAAPGIPARVVLNGKEGEVGLMPPIGGTLSDDQIAGVLTYIRREWGGTGSPVDPETIATVRKATADRTRPWTRDELTALPDGAR
jgi:mono/diheme cytochrome c family protein/glucose/arabinose dehydrogenase